MQPVAAAIFLPVAGIDTPDSAQISHTMRGQICPDQNMSNGQRLLWECCSMVLIIKFLLLYCFTVDAPKARLNIQTSHSDLYLNVSRAMLPISIVVNQTSERSP